MSASTDILREKARDCELNALACADKGEKRSADGFTVAALALYELANALDEAERERAA